MTTTYKWLSPIPPIVKWTTQAGSLGEFALRWLNALRDSIHYSFVATVSWTPSAVATITTAEQTVTVTGAATGDHVSVTPPGHQAGVVAAAARVTAANTIGVTFVNPTAGSVTPTAGNYIFKVTRP